MFALDQTPSLSSPQASPSPSVASSPSQLSLTVPLKQKHHVYHLTLIPGLGIAVTVVAVMMLVVLIFLIRRKSRELENSDTIDKASSKAFGQLPRRFQGGRILVTCHMVSIYRHGCFGNSYKWIWWWWLGGYWWWCSTVDHNNNFTF